MSIQGAVFNKSTLTLKRIVNDDQLIEGRHYLAYQTRSPQLMQVKGGRLTDIVGLHWNFNNFSRVYEVPE